MDANKEETAGGGSLNFIEHIVKDDLAAGKHDGRVHTRFPPEPNGYLHIGHAKSICLNFGIARDFGGKCNLRFDDTNPTKEDTSFVEGIREDIRWLGFDWEDREFFASDYFEKLYEMAVLLVEKGKAFVCHLNAEEMAAHRGTLKEPGRNSPYRDRPVEENLDLLRRMRAGEFAEGECTLRAKIDMAAANVTMRDPVLYRILKTPHHRTGDAWCIYPTYDFAHGQSDAIEGITHSLCSLEFEIHRPLYDWFLDNLDLPVRPRQYEFARLRINYTVMSKRRLRKLVEDGTVRGWDDPRMPTLRGMRRRGYPAAAIRHFCDRVGVARVNSTVDFALLEHCIRDHLNEAAPRRLAVLDPLKVVLTNIPEGETDELEAMNHPQNPEMGVRPLPFSREIYIERGDFMEDPPRKFHRLSPGKEVRLRYAYLMTCDEVIKDDVGEVIELRCHVDPDSRGGNAPDGRKVKGTIHWVSAEHAVDAEVRLYEHLFTKEDPDAAATLEECLSAESLTIAEAKVEPALADSRAADAFQLERHGYFAVDPDTTPDRLVLNRTVGLRDSWAKMTKK